MCVCVNLCSDACWLSCTSLCLPWKKNLEALNITGKLLNIFVLVSALGVGTDYL